MEDLHSVAGKINPDLFDYTPQRYPHHPGSKGLVTSLEAARRTAPRAGTARREILDVYRKAYPHGLTPDEAANAVDRPPLWTRPRVSELRQLGLLEATPVKRTNPDSGCEVFVLRATAKAMEA